MLTTNNLPQHSHGLVTMFANVADYVGRYFSATQVIEEGDESDFVYFLNFVLHERCGECVDWPDDEPWFAVFGDWSPPAVLF